MADREQNTQGGSSDQHDEQCQKVDVAKMPKSTKRRTSTKSRHKDTSNLVTKRKKINQDGSNDARKDVLIYDEEPLISCSVYTSWLMDSSDLVTKYKQVSEIDCTKTLTKLMELPPIALLTGIEWFSHVCKAKDKANLGQHRPGDSGTRVSMDRFQEDLGNNARAPCKAAHMFRGGEALSEVRDEENGEANMAQPVVEESTDEDLLDSSSSESG